MTEEIINTDGSRNWQANILLDNIKRLEQENKEERKAYNECIHYLACMTEQRNKLKTALEEIREMTKKYDAEVGDIIIANPIQDCYDIYCKINEVLQ